MNSQQKFFTAIFAFIIGMFFAACTTDPVQEIAPQMDFSIEANQNILSPELIEAINVQQEEVKSAASGCPNTCPNSVSIVLIPVDDQECGCLSPLSTIGWSNGQPSKNGQSPFVWTGAGYIATIPAFECRGTIVDLSLVYDFSPQCPFVDGLCFKYNVVICVQGEPSCQLVETLCLDASAGFVNISNWASWGNPTIPNTNACRLFVNPNWPTDPANAGVAQCADSCFGNEVICK